MELRLSCINPLIGKYTLSREWVKEISNQWLNARGITQLLMHWSYAPFGLIHQNDWCNNLASAIILSNVSASMLHQVLHMMTVMAHGNLIFLDVGLGILEGNQMRYAAWEILQTECQGYDIHLIKIDQFNQAWFSIHTFALEMPSNVSNIFNLFEIHQATLLSMKHPTKYITNVPVHYQEP